MPMEVSSSTEIIAQHLAALRKRLIDISNRNKLVSFRATKRACIEVAFPKISELYDQLTEGEEDLRLQLGIEYLVDDTRTKQKRPGAEPICVTRLDAERSLQRGQILCRHDEGDLEARADYIRREAKAVLDETGINHLYLALGFLRWRESDDSEQDRRAPLLLIPIIITRNAEAGRGGSRYFTIAHDGGDLFPNLSLIERLRTDFDLDLPKFGEESTDAEEYLADVARTIRGRQGWEVEETAFISFFSFAKMRMYIDLDPACWPEGCGLLENTLVQQILEGSLTETEETGYGGVDVTDDHPVAHDIPLVVEADSSQHTAILKTWEGRNLVVEGPPGTGKSQTITNMIAAALHQGKTVLFVSEKLAALEVVKRNLDVVGLGEFCLELHSHKTRKQEVHAAMRKRINWTPPTTNRFEATRQQWRRQVVQLKQYLEACGRCLGPRAEAAFRIMGRAISLRERAIPAIRDPLSRLDLDAEKFDDALTCLQEIGRHLQNPADFRDHPWKGFLCEQTRAGDELAIEREFGALAQELESAALEARRFDETTAADACPPPVYAERRAASGAKALPRLPVELACEILPQLVAVESSSALATAIGNARAHDDHLQAAEEVLSAGAITRGGLGQWLRESSDIAIAQRLGDTPISTLQETLPSLAEVAELAAEAAKLAVSIAKLELGSAATLHDLERFLARLRICGSAPTTIERLLTAEHRFPNAANVLTDARAEADHLTEARQRLEATFAPGDAPNSAAVQALKKCLRTTGGRWVSIFNRDYREARKKVLGFLRSRKLFVFPAILESLEHLEQWSKRTEDFSARHELRSVLGVGFAGLQTDWPAVTAAVEWVLAMTREALPWATVEKIAQPEAQRQVREFTTRLEAVFRRLESCTAAANVILEPLFEGRSYRSIELEDFCRVTTGWSDWLRQTLDAVFPVAIHKSSTFEQLSEAARHIIETERLAESLAKDEAFKKVAGAHARGLASDWKALTITRDWTEEIRGLALPTSLFEWLLSGATAERLTTVDTMLATFSATVARCRSIVSRLEGYGTVEQAWLWGSDGATWTGRLERARSIKAQAHLLQQWALFRKLYIRADELAARFAVDQVLGGALPPEQAHEAFDLAVNEFYGYEILRTFRELETFTHESRQHLSENFRKTDRELLQQAQAFVAQRAADRRPPSGNGTGPVKVWSEWALLRNEANKQTRHIPIRQLMQRAGRSVLAWKPCLMMSPLSVAQYLDPRCAPFDLVVMDEASQIRPEDALGAVARAKQIVVVGDTKQMPPSNYWSRTLNDDDDDEDTDEETAGRGVAQDSESILECAKNAFPPAQRLLWHYRSQHESLIRFSNYAYYDEELIVFPAASDDAGRLGIKFHHLPEGRYKSGARVNEIEAQIVARAALDHLMENPSETLLVATFNRPQQELIDALVDKYAAEDEAMIERLEEARQHAKEPFAVKNLENVQGDERDVIFVSCTYGADLNSGKVMQRFGPVAGAGGRRRLNVLFTRAKQRLEVFSSMTHDQILGRPGEPNGVNDLRDYLRFAQTGVLADSGRRTGQAPDSYFEEAVMRVVESAGLRAIPQVGVSSYRIDIGVEHPSRPGEFLLGIECDGAMYHSAKTARDRDRLRQEVLERRGWKIHRIWSTDWFRQNQAARKRLLDVLQSLIR
jgi:very-short-patch-repair endonuclease